MTLDLFSPIARTTDPQTSHLGAALVTASGARQKNADTLLEMIRRYPNRTAMELCEQMILYKIHWLVAYQTASKRTSDLEKAGAIRCTGERVCAVSGNKARTWIAA